MGGCNKYEYDHECKYGFDVGLGGSVITRTSISINLNFSSSLGMIRDTNISMRITLRVNPSDSR